MKGLSARDPQSYSESSAQPIIQTSGAINVSQNNKNISKSCQVIIFFWHSEGKNWTAYSHLELD